MVLQFIVMIGMVGFCIWQFVEQVSAPSPVYLPLTYIICPILLVIGLGKRGVVTWPIATVLLLIEGHWIVGWIPGLLVGLTVIGNKWLMKKYPTDCPMCKKRIESWQEFERYHGIHVHAGECLDLLKTELHKGKC